jgi:Ni/Co efflux regulator RcnB
VKRLIWIVMAGVLVSGAGFVSRAEAGDRGKHNRRHHAVVQPVRYWGPRDVTVIREYYRPYYRPLSRPARHAYARAGYLPPGWARRIQPIPVYVGAQLPPAPYGYHRGIIDGRAVVYNRSGFIFDVAVLF